MWLVDALTGYSVAWLLDATPAAVARSECFSGGGGTKSITRRWLRALEAMDMNRTEI